MLGDVLSDSGELVGDLFASPHLKNLPDEVPCLSHGGPFEGHSMLVLGVVRLFEPFCQIVRGGVSKITVNLSRARN
jgi:hypothetical protein